MENEIRDIELKRRRALDFFIGLAFLAFGIMVLLNGLTMLSSPELEGVDKITNPGSTTTFIGVLIVLLSSIITIMGIVQSGNPFAQAIPAIKETLAKVEFKRGVIILVILGVYYLVLWELIPYVISTFLFLVTLMVMFKAGAWWKIVLIAAGVVALVWFVFGTLASVPLPGM